LCPCPAGISCQDAGDICCVDRDGVPRCLDRGEVGEACPLFCDENSPCPDSEDCCVGGLYCLPGFCDEGQECCAGALLTCCQPGLCNPSTGSCFIQCEDATGCPTGQNCCNDICVPNTNPNHCNGCGNVCAPVDVCTPGECVPGFPAPRCNTLSCRNLDPFVGGCCDIDSGECIPRGTIDNCASCGDVCTSADPCRRPVCFGVQNDPFTYFCGTAPICPAGEACCFDAQGQQFCATGSACPSSGP
jgi:hypothetical protein